MEPGYYKELKQTRKTLSDFRSNLFGIRRSLSDKDVRDLVYLSPESECPKDVQDSLEYFDQLERKGLISPSGYDYLLDRLTQIQKEDLAMQLMHYSCQSQHTPNSLSARLSARLLDSGKEDVVVQIMKSKLRVQRLPSGLCESNQTLVIVFTAKQGMCTAHMKAVANLCDPYTLNEVGKLVEKYFDRSLLQCTKVKKEAEVYQWPRISEFEDKGILGELLEKTLESIFSFADAFCVNMDTVLNMEPIDPQRIECSAKDCNSAFDRFSESLKDSDWNHDARQDAIDRKTMRDFHLDEQGQSACKAIADICEGLPHGDSVQKAERSANEQLFTVNISMYACWYSEPMYHWMRTLIQMAASSKLDMTKYHDHFIKIVANHRERIIKYYSKFTQLLGKDVMKMVDPALNIPQQKTVRSTTDNWTMVEYMTVYFYMYLLQLVALTGSSSSSQSEMAEHFAIIHQEFHENSYAEALKSSMEVARKIITATQTQVEDFKQQAIKLCTNSPEGFLLSKVLST